MLIISNINIDFMQPRKLHKNTPANGGACMGPQPQRHKAQIE